MMSQGKAIIGISVRRASFPPIPATCRAAAHYRLVSRQSLPGARSLPQCEGHLPWCMQVADECKQKGSAEAKTYSVDLSDTDNTAKFGKKLQVPLPLLT